MTQQQSWYAHGKLLVTGEYLVMKGTQGLALPLKQGQSLHVEQIQSKQAELIWIADHPQGNWFRSRHTLPDLKDVESTRQELSHKLTNILQAIRQLNPDFLNGNQSFRVHTRLEFNPEFGFGSSSTLLANLARWAQVDPYVLQFSIWGGSAYDIACARADGPILYSLKNGRPAVQPVRFNPPFRHHLYFVYLGHKQRTTKSIRYFKDNARFSADVLEHISAISHEITQTSDLKSFNRLINEHEKIIAKVMGLPTVKEKLFAKAPFQVKSLGAWGGDFVLISSEWPKNKLCQYLKKSGFDICFTWDDLIL